MPRQIKGDDAERLCDFRIIQQLPILARISAGSVEAEQGRPLPGFFKEDPLINACNVQVHVAPDYTFKKSHDHPLRGAIANSLCNTRRLRSKQIRSEGMENPGWFFSRARKSLSRGSGFTPNHLANAGWSP
ncbi:hypothetical protein D9M71_633880 [compost metagenome]